MPRKQPIESARRPPRTRSGAPDAALSATDADTRLARVLGVLIVLTTLACFSPTFTAEFSNWDDSQTIARNPRLNPPTLANCLSFWNPRHPYMDLYVPVTYTAWSALAAVAYVPEPDEQGIRLNPWVFHGANVAIHAASALAAFALLRRLVKSAPAAAAGALLFALHPVQVEPVAWTSGTKDVLWGLLALVAVWQYVAFVQTDARASDSGPDPSHCLPRPGAHYAAATAAFVLAMLAKPTAVVLPAVVLVIDVLLLGRPVRKAILSALPWLLLALPVMIEARYAQPASRENMLAQRVPLPLRPLVAADATAFYLYKLVFPVHLGPLYDRAPMTVLQQKWHLYTWLAPVTLAGVAVALLRRAPWLAAAVAIFVLGFAPVSGLVPFDFQTFSTVSDHYLYVSMLGPAVAAAFALDGLLRRGTPRARRGALAALAVVLAVLGVRSLLQARHWRDSVALFRQATRVNPNSHVAHTQLAMALEDRHRLGEALAAYEAAARVRPDLPETRANFAGILVRTGELDRAEAVLREVLVAYPKFEPARLGLEELERVRSQKASPTTRDSDRTSKRPATGVSS